MNILDDLNVSDINMTEVLFEHITLKYHRYTRNTRTVHYKILTIKDIVLHERLL